MKTANCLNCNQPLRGRSDKKYCHYSCKNEHYNRLHAEHNSYIKQVNKVLRRNRRILAQLKPKSSKNTVSLRQLYDMGFSFTHFTHVETRSDKTTFFCYEFGYIPLENNYFALV